jgi:hypothetical protein
LIREGGLPDFAWQRNFYEHIVRSEAALTRIRRYVLDNPQMWGFDVENPGMPVGAHGRIRQVLAHRYGFDEDEVAAAMGTDRAQ